MAKHTHLDHQWRPRLRPKRMEIVSLYTAPPVDATIVCVVELGPVISRTYPPAPAWSSNGHRIKAHLDYSRGPEKVWVYGGLGGRDEQVLTLTTHSRNTAGYRQLLEAIELANTIGDLYVVTDNLASHKCPPIQEWLAAHPRVHQVIIPVGASWLDLQEGWWRIYHREALAGQSFVDDKEIAYARKVATEQLNCRPKPWIWRRPPHPHRRLRHTFVYRL